MREAREKINLANLDIGPVRPRRAATGALHLEIAGDDREGKADTLAAHLKTVLAGKEGVRVTRPSKMAEIRLKNLEEFVTAGELAVAVAENVGRTR